MPAFFKESEPTGNWLWTSMTREGRQEVIDRVNKELNNELFNDILDRAMWQGVRDEALYDYLKDKVYLTIDFK